MIILSFVLQNKHGWLICVFTQQILFSIIRFSFWQHLILKFQVKESSLNCRVLVKVLLNNTIFEFLYVLVFISIYAFYFWLSAVYNMYDGF